MTSLKSTELFHCMCKHIGKSLQYRTISSTQKSSSFKSVAQAQPERSQDASIELDIPIVTSQCGKWVRLEGHSKALLNFTSKDVFAIQNNTHLSEAEQKATSLNGLSSNYKCYYQSLPAQKRLEEKLATLHHKESSILSTETFGQTLNKWLRKMPKDNRVYVQESCKLVEDDLQTGVFMNETDLEKCLLKEADTSFVVVQAGSNAESIRELGKICTVAEKHNAGVLLLDPYGIILIRHAIGDIEETLNILKKPTMIQTTLDLIHGDDSITYISGPRKFTEWCAQVLPFETQVIGPPLVARTLKAFELLPMHSGNVYGSLLQSLKLKQELEEFGLTVKGDAIDLTLSLDGQCCQMVVDDLIQKGHYVSAVSDNGDTGIKMIINGHHDGKDIKKFKEDLLSSLRSQGMINEEVVLINGSKVQLPMQQTGQQSLRELLQMKDQCDQNDQSNHHESNHKDSLHFTSNTLKINPQHLVQDLKWLKSLYCTSIFDEQLQENLSFFDYK